MSGTTLICTFYSFGPIVASATAYSPTKIILLVATNSLRKPGVKEDIEKTKATYRNIAPVSMVETDEPDLLATAVATTKAIETEYHAGNRVIVNITGGWKLLAQGVLYACYAREGMVERIICNDLTEDGKIVELPKLSFGLSGVKRGLLKEIAGRTGASISDIAKKLGKTRAMLYQHLKELRAVGYVNEKFEITLAGRLALL
jgi:CRISPR-associated protein Csa3